MYRKNNFSFLNQLPVLKTLNAHIFTLYVVELYVLKRDLSTDLFNCYSIVALSNALTKSYNAAVSKFEYIKIDRDKSTFKSHRDFDSEIEMTFKHF